MMVGEYRVVEFLGRGGMGEVYRAVHNKIGRTAAVKVLTAATDTAGLLDRFYNEGRIQASLHHPNVATLYDFIEVEGMPCIIMEYVDGQTLAERIRPSGPLALGETVFVFQSVVEAIAYVHNHGIIHRDIKSNNIKVSTAGQVKLLDFGIAKGEASPGLTETGSVVGTLEYISPEQLMGGVADARSDIWALGVLLYEMVTGRVPFEALTLGELCRKIQKVEYAPANVLNPTVPREVTTIISRCLRKNPLDRYRLAQDLLEDTRRLRALVSTPGLTSVGGPRPRRLPSAAQLLAGVNWKLVSAAAGGLALLLVLAGGAYLVAGGIGASAPGEPDAGLSTQAAPGGAGRPEGAQQKTVTIDAVGGKADVYREGRKLGETPFPLDVQVGSTVSLILKRDGYEDYSDKFTVTAQTRTKTYSMRRKSAGSSDASN